MTKNRLARTLGGCALAVLAMGCLMLGCGVMATCGLMIL